MQYIYWHTFLCSFLWLLSHLSPFYKPNPVPDNARVVMHNHPRYILDHYHSIAHLKEMPPAPLYKNKTKTWRNPPDNLSTWLRETVTCFTFSRLTWILNAAVARFLLKHCSVDCMYLQTEHIWVDIISIHVLLRLTRPEGEPSRAES